MAYPDDLVVDPALIASRLGKSDPSPAELDEIEDAIRDAQADVQGYLNRDLFAVEATLSGIYADSTWPLNDWRAWPNARQFDDTVTVVSYVALPDGTYDVTFKVGLDGPNESRVARYVKAHTIESLRNSADSKLGKRQITSISAEGQSVSYAQGSVAEGAAGSLPNITTLSGMRRRAVHRASRAPIAVWPLSGSGYYDGR